MEKINLPPFLPGDKVIYIGPTNNGYVKDKKYSVISCHKSACGCDYWVVDVGVPDVGGIQCSRCDKLWHPPTLDLIYSLFRPIQEQQFPLMTFAKIVEIEKEEILINN